MTELTPAQDDLMRVIYGGFGLWDPPCQHLHPAWEIDAEGVGRCTMCLATWTMADERERAARIAAGPPEGESDRDRMWREFREAAWRGRPLIMSIPPGREAETPPESRAAYESCHFWDMRARECRYEMLFLGCEPCKACPG